MTVQIPASPISSADPKSPLSTASSKQSRRSFIMMANNLKPTRQKLQKYFAKSRHSAPEPVFKEWQAQNLSSVIKLASMQMGVLGNPDVPISPVVQVQDSRYKPSLVRVDTEQQRKHKPGPTPELEFLDTECESHLAQPLPPPAPAADDSAQPPALACPALADSSVEASVVSPHQEEFVASPSSPSLAPCDASSEAILPSPQPLSPSPSIPSLPLPPRFAELPQLPDIMSMETDPTEPRVRRGPSLIQPRPKSSVQRRVKTPFHKDPQMNMAPGVDRQSSVRSIARQYRTLVEDTLFEDTLVEEADLVPQVLGTPSLHRKSLSETAASVPASELQEFDENDGPIPRHSSVELRHGAGLLESPRPRSELVPSPVASDADTLVSFHDEAAYLTPLLFPPPLIPPSAEKEEVMDVEVKDKKEKSCCDKEDTDAAPFKIAFDLLTRELSTAFADSSARSARDTSGLQVWVMIAAYERLRDQISAMESPDPQLEGARAMFDTWLDALRAVQKSIADEGAESGSEYGDE